MSATIPQCLGLVALLLCGACDPTPSPTQSESATAATAASGPTARAKAVPVASAGKKLRTTNASIAVRNIDTKIREVSKQLERDPKNVVVMHTLLALHLIRSSRLGKISDLDVVVALGERAVRDSHRQKQALLVRASAHSAVHRFADALLDLDKAESLGVSTYKTELSRAAILIGLGRYDEGLAIIQARRSKQGDSFETLFAEGMALAHMGRYERADKLFEGALGKFRSVTPFPVAQLEFERGAMWDRAGDAKRAQKYYRAAVERLPQFAHAAGHLVYKLPHGEAVTLVKQLIESSDDPEYVGALGYLMNKKDPGSGAEHVQTAKGLYATLMKKHALAFADHAGWFYVLIAHDYERAVEVAEMNLDNRATPEAFELMLAALVGARQGTEACEVADRAVALKYVTAGLERHAAAAYALCGRKDEAAELRAGGRSGGDSQVR